MARLNFHWGKHSTASLWDAVCRQFPKVERASLGNFPAVPFLLTSTNKLAESIRGGLASGSALAFAPTVVLLAL